MVRCPRCGHAFRPVSGFCPNCLARVRPPLAPRVLFGIAGLCVLALTLAVDAAVLAMNAESTGAWVIPSTSQASPSSQGSPSSQASPSSQPARSADTPSVPLVPPGIVALGNMPDTSTERAPDARVDQKRVGFSRSLN